MSTTLSKASHDDHRQIPKHKQAYPVHRQSRRKTAWYEHDSTSVYLTLDEEVILSGPK